MQAIDPGPGHGDLSHRELANTIRVLAMDAVEAAQSGHPGMPMGMADVATVLATRFLKFDAADPTWPDRDRFVLSAGHGSMLLYALLYLTGYSGVDLQALRDFRKLGSVTAGHPEFGHVGGIETTTGPLGQGLATAVGMALAERMMAARFGADLVDHHTYVLVGDGCLMEGISHEAASLAGHLKLDRLIVLFDDNGISIDGPTSLTVSDDQLMRFESLGWHVLSADGHDPDAIAAAIGAAQRDPRPSLIACHTTIGFGAPTKAGSAATHGAPLGAEEVAGTRQALGWNLPPFEIPPAILDSWRAIGARGGSARRAWEARKAAAPAKTRDAFETALTGALPPTWSADLADFVRTLTAKAPAMATRKASQHVLGHVNSVLNMTVGGSADLTGSNNTKTDAMVPVSADDFTGRYIYYGVREHAMAAAMNGIALHKGFIPYGGTFLVFSDYARPAMRLSALMGQRVIYVMTHDSIGLGEDGPTHQPAEHLASLRAIPNMLVLRPADAVETAECWDIALRRRDGPTVIALTRQTVPAVRRDGGDGNRCTAGAYEIAAASGSAQVSLLATGSEVSLAVEVQRLLQNSGVAARVVSMPCWELFAQRPAAERCKVLGVGTLRVGIEAAARLGWDRWIGADGLFFGIDGFGVSGPYKDVYAHFGLTADAVSAAVSAKL